MAGANMLYGMGMLDMGMTFSYTQLILDNEIANMANRVVRGIEVNDATLAVDVIRSVGGGVGKQFLMEDHTMEYMRSEQQSTRIFDRQPREFWLANGAKDTATRAQEKALQIFNDHKAIALDAPTLNELKRIVDSMK